MVYGFEKYKYHNVLHIYNDVNFCKDGQMFLYSCTNLSYAVFRA